MNDQQRGPGAPFRFIEVRNNLKAKASQGTGMPADEAVSAAESRIGKMSGEYDERLAAQILSIRQIVQRAVDLHEAGGEDDGAWVPELHRLSHDLEGQAGIFDYEVLSFISASLNRVLTGSTIESPKFVATIQAHCDALALVHSQRITGDGGPEGRRLITGLRATAAKTLQIGHADEQVKEHRRGDTREASDNADPAYGSAE